MKYKIEYSNKINNFTRWFLNNEGMTKLEINNGSYGFETYANKEIKQNDIILQIPRSIIITNEDCSKFPIWNTQLLESIDNIDILVAGLTWLKKNDNKYKPYLDLLPENYNNFPTNWSENKLELIKDTYIYQNIIEYKESISNQYQILKKIINYDLSYSEYLWSRNAVTSRNFTIIINGIKYYALIPYADLLNHSFNNNASYFFDNKSNSFHVISTRNINFQDIVIDSYGENKLAHHFLIYYGFLPNDYRNQVVKINNISLNIERKQNISDDIRYIINKKINNINNILNNNIINDSLILRILKSEKEIMMVNL